MVAHRVLAYLLVLCILSGNASAATRAFVVGIDRYDNLPPSRQLERAVNDARSVTEAFQSLGYDVSLQENSNRSEFNAAWQAFLEKVQLGDTVAFFFAGHGVEIDGQNYLLPRNMPNIRYGREAQIRRESLSLDELLNDLRERKPGVSLVILDACRDHPLIPPEYRSVGAKGGLASVHAPEGTFIMYSAGTGETALDRLPGDDTSPNSLYTRMLVPMLKEPGVAIADLARNIRVRVHDVAKSVLHRQRPAYYDGLIGRFCVAGCEKSDESTSRLGDWNAVLKDVGPPPDIPFPPRSTPADTCARENPPISCLWGK